MSSFAWSTYDLARRHRRKLLLAASASGAVVLVGKLADSRLRSYLKQESDARLEQARRQHHFDSTDRTGGVTLQSLYPPLRRAVNAACDVAATLAQIKASTDRSEKVRLWTRLRTETLGRCAAYVLAHVLLTLLLRVQMNVLGGHLYRQTVDRKKKDENRNHGDVDDGLTQKVQEAYVSVCQRFVAEGTSALAEAVREIVEESLASRSDLGLQEKIKASQLREVLASLILDAQTRHGRTLLVGLLRKAATAADGRKQFETEAESRVFQSLVWDTADVLDTDEADFVAAAYCRDGAAFLAEKATESAFDDVDSSVPLAKLIPLLVRANESDLDSPSQVVEDAWLSGLVADCGDMKRFGGNVYEAFCSEQVNKRSNEAASAAPGHRTSYSEPDLLGGLVKFVQSVLS